MKTGVKGAILAATVGLMFMANIAMAQENGSAEAGSTPSAQTAKLKCGDRRRLSERT
jgi:hypothetical protein